MAQARCLPMGRRSSLTPIRVILATVSAWSILIGTGQRLLLTLSTRAGNVLARKQEIIPLTCRRVLKC